MPLGAMPVQVDQAPNGSTRQRIIIGENRARSETPTKQPLPPALGQTSSSDPAGSKIPRP